ncbi:hypothetical protein GLA29479_650 [Lysobacter antibioticus]|nr:hypothetical protein GLA29479_650 [Lysobacter antibioticus]
MRRAMREPATIVVAAGYRGVAAGAPQCPVQAVKRLSDLRTRLGGFAGSGGNERGEQSTGRWPQRRRGVGGRPIVRPWISGWSRRAPKSRGRGLRRSYRDRFAALHRSSKCKASFR